MKIRFQNVLCILVYFLFIACPLMSAESVESPEIQNLRVKIAKIEMEIINIEPPIIGLKVQKKQRLEGQLKTLQEKVKNLLEEEKQKLLEHEEKSDPTVKEEKKEHEQVEHHENIAGGIVLEKDMSPDKVIEFLNQAPQKNLLKRIVKVVFNREKNESYVEELECKHDIGVVDGWKQCKNPGGISNWASLKDRKQLVLFTDKNFNTTSFIEEHLEEPTVIEVKKLKGHGVIIISAIWEVGSKIGEEYTDNRVEKDFQRIKQLKIKYDNDLEKDLDQINKEDLTRIKIRIQINTLVEDIINNGELPKNEDIFNTFKINAICPTANLHD